MTSEHFEEKAMPSNENTKRCEGPGKTDLCSSKVFGLPLGAGLDLNTLLTPVASDVCETRPLWSKSNAHLGVQLLLLTQPAQGLV